MSVFVRHVRGPVAAVLLLSGCFRYVPAEVTPLPSPRTEVRITLNHPMDVSMGEFTINEVDQIEGIVTETQGDTLDLVARWLHPRSGRRFDAMMSSYVIPVTQIERLEEWRVSGKRTVGVVAITAATFVLFFDLVRRALGGNEPGGPPPDTQSIVAPR